AGVARLGYRALAAGRPVIVTGLSNRVLAVLGRFAPHWLSFRGAELLMSPEGPSARAPVCWASILIGDQPGPREGCERPRFHRSGEEMPLAEIAADLAQKLVLRLGLDPLGHHRGAVHPRDVQESLRQLLAVRRADLADEAGIDLDDIDRVVP